MSFKIVVDKAKTLSDITEAVNVLADEATIQFNATGIKIALMDPSRVAMLNLELPSTFFTEYSCNTPVNIGLSINELHRLLKTAASDEKTVFTNIGDTKLNLIFEGERHRVFKLPTMEPASETPPKPKMSYTSSAKIVSDGLMKTLTDSELCSDHVIIQSVDGALQFDSVGDLLESHVTLNKGECLLSLEGEVDVKACYSLSYLSTIVKTCSKLSELICLEYSSDCPVKLDFQMQEGTLEFYLAPRLMHE